MVTGRVVRFDGARGYGFIAPQTGGEDVFLHVNDMLIPEKYVRSGLAVQFEVEEGERGPKASSVRLAVDADGNPLTPPASLAVPAVPAGEGGRVAAGDGDGLCDVLGADEYLKEVTEVLLRAAPSLTGQQILAVRAGLAKSAEEHGWTDH
ncbi:cold shock domain-containing protein [Streptomyces sp. NRRL S-495]|uniref:cold-shock protein n=1 Tax=Streptomyces sp. NRRL S-495 TaxID=1609133 RepID=UPI0005F8D014|nr:cold shock domain-containing protein [Streptomyces sp. NRRL S-495]KJY32820.1 DNA-binding protein [Streptomyces sp. NRRL S-495]